VEFPSATDTETKSARPPAQLDGVELVIIQRRFRSVPVGVGGVAGSVVEGRSDGEGDGVAGIFDEVDDVAVMEPRNVVVVDRQDSVADLQPRAALRRTLPDDLTDERDAFGDGGNDDESDPSSSLRMTVTS